MEKKNKFKLGILCICIIIVITMWTGIHTKDKKGMIEGIQDMFIDYIVDVGMSNIGIISQSGTQLAGLECTDAFMTGATKFKPYIQLTSTTYNGETTLCIAQKCSDEDEKRIRELLDEIEAQLLNFIA